MLAEGYENDILEQINELRDLLVCERHELADFERKRFRSYECTECGHNINKQQLAALYHLEKAQEIIEVDSRVALDDLGNEPDIVHPTD
jgi:hypothetical protein